MRTRLFGFVGSMGATIAVLSLAPGYAAGQVATAPAAGQAASAPADAPAYMPPRTPDGQPDISGIYEAVPLPGDIETPLVPAPPRQGGGGAGEYSFMITRPGLPAGTVRRPAVVDPADGKIPLRPEALELRKETIANQHKLDWLDGRVLCLPPGVPRTNVPAPVVGYQILQKPGYVVIFYEQSHLYRIIPLDGRPHVSPKIRMAMGDSRGRWEGNTLVVEVTNHPTTLTRHNWVIGRASVRENTPAESLVSGHGISYTDAFKVTERFTPISADTIRYEAVIEDPNVFTQPWTISWDAFQRAPKDYVPVEYACHEGNAPNIDLMVGVDTTHVRVDIP